MNSLENEFRKYISDRFDPKNGTIASYLRAVTCVLEYLDVYDFDNAVLHLDDIKMFGYAPKNAREFKNIYPRFNIGDSYIEKGFIKAAIRHFELFIESRVKERIGVIEECDRVELSKFSENFLENLLNHKDDAKIVNVTKELKTRVLNRSIIDSLKGYYNHRCQICEKQFSKVYGVDICEGHHIEHFVKTFNNNPENIIVLCPDHHRLMHCANPILERSSLEFIYPNGYSEKVKLVDHFVKC